MLPRPLALVAFAATVVPAAAQSTWVVDAAGGTGVHFADLPSAVAAAAHGDTILVFAGPTGEGADPFTTSKGLTIVGVGGAVPIGSSVTAPFRVQNLPAGRAFRMVGFDRPSNGELNFEILNCAGVVHLERLRCREPGAVSPSWPSIVVSNSPDVTMREIGTFGDPAVQVTQSGVTIVGCQLGVTYIGLGGGRWIDASSSTIEIVQPAFDTGFGVAQGVTASNCVLRIAGNTTSSMNNLGGDVVVANGGQVFRDPAVSIVSGLGVPFSGTAPVTTVPVPATYTGRAIAGTTLQVTSLAPFGSFVFQALGTPGPRIATPLGPLGIDPAQPFGFWPGGQVGASGSLTLQLPVPAGFTPGVAFATQGAVLTATSLTIGLPCTFTTH